MPPAAPPADPNAPFNPRSAAPAPAAIPCFGLRAVLIALLLTPLCAYWAADQGVDTIMSLLVPPVACLMVLVGINALVGRAAPRVALTTTELVIIYGMLQVATAISAEWTGVINGPIGSFSVFKGRFKKFEKYMLPNLPGWLYLKDASRIPEYETGGRDLSGFLRRLPIWWGPIAGWTLLALIVCFAMLCIKDHAPGVDGA